MVWPGSSPTPEVTTRVGMPSVWLSTAAMTSRDRIRGPPCSAGLRPAVVGIGGWQSQPGQADRAAVQPGLLLGHLDRLDEAGVGVPAQERAGSAV